MDAAKIVGTVEAWESGALGRDAEHAKRAPKETEQQIDDALGLRAISIRLQKDLIDQYKLIAKIHGVGYQPLMRDALKRFAESEIKILLTQIAENPAGVKAGRKIVSDTPPLIEHKEAA